MAKQKHAEPHAVRFPGIAIVLGGDTFIMPPLALGKLEQLQKRIQNFTGGTDADSINTVLDCAHAALARNYPEMSRDELGELVDVGNMMEVMQAAMDVSGLIRKGLEAQAAQEVAGEGAGPLTSASSTPTSAPVSDGPGTTSEST